MSKPFDYSKWDKIDLSDDEDDVHPNIDKASWFRWKHKARVEREENEAKEVADIEASNKIARARRDQILRRLQSLMDEADNDDPEEQQEEKDRLNSELKEIMDGIAGRENRIAEIEKNKTWNADNMSTVVKEKTIINKAEKPAVLPVSEEWIKTREEKQKQKDEEALNQKLTEQVSISSKSSSLVGPSEKKALTEVDTKGLPLLTYQEFTEQYAELMETFCDLNSLEQTKEMLMNEGHILLADHAQNYILLTCLEDEMNGLRDRMKNVCRQSQLLSHITELAKSLNRNPRDMVRPFFAKLEEMEQLKSFQSQVDDFTVKIQKRAVEKRKEMNLDQEELSREERLGPGGLDPVEVFESLPKDFQEAFESRDVEKLQAALQSLPLEEAKKIMKDCQDSGLWVANGDENEG